MKNYKQAIPYYNFKNNFLLYILFNLINNKTAFDLIEYIKKILQTYKTYIFEKNITKIYNRMFYDNYLLETVVIPDTVEIIEQEAFLCCSNLKNVSIPKNVINIQSSAFICCDNLNTINIPKNEKDLTINYGPDSINYERTYYNLLIIIDSFCGIDKVYLI